MTSTMTDALLLDDVRTGLDTGVALQPLRPIHAIDLAILVLPIDGLGSGNDLTRQVRTRRWVLRQVAHRQADHRTYVARRDGHVVGVVLLEHLRRERTFAAELTAYVDERERRDHGTVDVVRAGVNTARELGLHRLEAALLPDDHASRVDLSQAGFAAVGLSHGYRLVDGHWRDHVLHELLLTG